MRSNSGQRSTRGTALRAILCSIQLYLHSPGYNQDCVWAPGSEGEGSEKVPLGGRNSCRTGFTGRDPPAEGQQGRRGVIQAHLHYFLSFFSVSNMLIHIFLAGNSHSKTLLPPSVTSFSHPQTSSPPPQPPRHVLQRENKRVGEVLPVAAASPAHYTEYDRKSRAAPVAEATAHCCQHKLLAAECLSESCDAFGATNHAGCSLQGRAGVTLSSRELLLSIQTN